MRPITVSELATRICRPNENVEAVIDRLRNWTNEGLLSPRGEVNPGTGRKRHYDENALLNALVLTAIVDLGLPAVSGTKFKNRESTLFQLARAGFKRAKENRDEGVFLVFSANPEQNNTVFVCYGKDVLGVDDKGTVTIRAIQA